jgi:phosphohistidine phosphatase
MPRFELVLMRHGHAEDWAEGGDAERALTQQGCDRVALMGAALRSMGVQPAVAICSPLRRAQQTAALVVQQCAPELSVATEPMLVPPAPPSRTVEQLVAHAPANGQVLLAVGHNPNVTAVLGHLVCGDSGLHFAVAPGDLAHVAIEATSRSIRGVLRAFVPSATVEVLAQ